MKTILAPSGVSQNEDPGLIFRTSILKNQGSSPSSILFAWKRQNSTPCDWLAKVWSSTLDISQSYNAGSTVTFNRFLRSDSDFLAILWHNIAQKRINIHVNLCAIIADYAIGLTSNEKNKPNSGRYAPGRDGGEDADVPDRRGRTGHTHVGQSLVRVLSFGGHGRLHEDGDVGSRYCDGSETDNPVRAQGITDGSMSDSIKPFTSAECGRRFTLTAPCYPIIQILDGAFRPAELFPNVSSAGKHLSPVREHTSEKWEGGALAPPETHPEAI